VSLEGRRALVTGSTRGVGRAIAEALADAGAGVLLHGLARDADAEAALAALARGGVPPRLLVADLGDDVETVSRRLFEEAVAAEPGIDLLVNNAGSVFDVPFLEMSYERFDRTLKLNVYAYYLLAQRFARYWVGRGVEGRILCVGSINGRLAEPHHTAYDTSKGAVEMMVKTLCVALAPHGIRINGIAPGLFRTPLTASALDDARFRGWMEHHTPNGEVPGPEACAAGAVYLLSDAARHVHGHMLLVDGGMSAWQQPDPEPA
jgi:NAD(P)-dependent dehydrogenase (short-subunit alcohol dehydrogenase family)